MGSWDRQNTTPPILRGTAEAGAAMAIFTAAPVANKAFLKLVNPNPPDNIYQFELGSNIVIEANIVPILKEFFILLKLIKDFDKNLLKWLSPKVLEVRSEAYRHFWPIRISLSSRARRDFLPF